jgi:hypothetical protein
MLIKRILKDMLTEDGKVSQSRIYLLCSLIAYYVTLGIITYGGLDKTNPLNIDNFKIIIDALEYAMVLFAGYTFGGKFLDVIKVIGTYKNKSTNEKESL